MKITRDERLCSVCATLMSPLSRIRPSAEDGEYVSCRVYGEEEKDYKKERGYPAG